MYRVKEQQGVFIPQKNNERKKIGRTILEVLLYSRESKKPKDASDAV